jgi:hypothetical protein
MGKGNHGDDYDVGATLAVARNPANTYMVNGITQFGRIKKKHPNQKNHSSDK